MRTATVSVLEASAPALDAPADGELSTVICKALQILSSFEGAHSPLGVSELARLAGLPKSTTYRMLRQLMGSGYVTRTGTQYRLSRRVFELGNHILECRPAGLRDTALPFLAELYQRAANTVHLAVLEGNDVLYLEKIQGARMIRTPTTVGSRLPAVTTAAGKAMLAFSTADTVHCAVANGLVRRTRYSLITPGHLAQQLAQTRTSRVAHDREETALGLVCVASPVLLGGRAIAAVSVSGPAERFEAAAAGRHVQRAASAISAELRASA